MTIISARQARFPLSGSLIAVFLFVAIIAIWFVMINNSVVALHYDLQRIERSIDDLKAKNADLKNAVFEKTTAGVLLELATNARLQKVISPSYMRTGEEPWAVVSRR